MQGPNKTNTRFARRLARLAEAGALVRLVDAQLESARREFAKATLARKLAPSDRTAKAQVKAFLVLRDAAAEVAS